MIGQSLMAATIAEAPPSGDPDIAFRTAILSLDGDLTAAKGGAWSIEGGSTLTFTADNPPFPGLQSLQYAGGSVHPISPAALSNLGAGDFGVELLCRCTSTSNSYRALIGCYGGGGNTWNLWLADTGAVYYYGEGDSLEMTGGPDQRDSAWWLVQLVRISGRLALRSGRVGVDANTVERAFVADNTMNFGSSGGIRLGVEAAYAGSPFFGELAQARVTVGKAPSFAVPSEPWPTA